MKLMTVTRATLVAASLGAGTLPAQTTYYSTGNNKSVDDTASWSDASGGGSAPPAMPTSPDGDTWVIENGDRMLTQNGEGNDGVFSGSTLVIEASGSNDSELLMNGGDNTGTGAFVLQDVMLDGGAINTFRSNNRRMEMAGLSVTANTGAIGAEDDPARYFFATITGGDEIRIQARGNGSPTTGNVNDGRVEFETGIDFSGFTGLFRVQSDTSTTNYGFLHFNQNIPTASFGMILEETPASMGTYTLDWDVSVTTLSIGPDHMAPGTYALDPEVLAANPTHIDLSNVGGKDYSAFFDYNDGLDSGSLTVTTAQAVTLPAVVQGPAAGIDETVASVPGVVTESGGETPSLTVHYGTADGGTDPGAWTNSVAVGPVFGAFDQQLTGLTNNTTYFYRCKVTNAAGDGWADFSDSFTTGTVPDTLVSVVNFGNIDESTTWQGLPPVPVSGTGDTKTWRVSGTVDRGDPSETVSFAGRTLVIGDGDGESGTLRLEDGSGTLGVRDVVLNGNGRIFQDRDTNTLAGDTLTIAGDGSLAAAERNGTMILDFENYAGDGTLYSFGNNANGNNALVFRTSNASSGTAMQGFTGTIHRDRLNGGGGCVRWEFSVTVPTFALKLADTDADLPPATNNEGANDGATHNGKMFLTDGVDVMVTGVHLFDQNADGTVNVDVHLPDGTYTLDTGTHPDATHLANVGGQDYSRFFKGGTGTVTVVSGGASASGPDIVRIRHLGTRVELDLEGLEATGSYRVYRDTVLPLSGSKVPVGGPVTGVAAVTVTDDGPLPAKGFYQAERE